MYQIQVLNNIDSQGLQLFSATHYALSSQIADPDAIVLRSHSLLDMNINANLKAIARAGAGTNNIPVNKLTAKGIPVFNTPGANANAVKELVIAALLLAARNICNSWQATLKLTGAEVAEQVESLKKDYTGFELPGRTLGVIGLGAIGVEVANTALALGMQVIGYDPQITIQNAWRLSAQVNIANSLNEVLRSADFVTLHVPYVQDTHHLIDEAKLKLMKPSAILLNFARGQIVSQAALLEALNADTLSAYVTDFPTAELIASRKTICLPHLGASTLEAEQNCALMACATLKKFLEFGIIENSVNFPLVDLPFNGAPRLAIVNNNVPNMVGQISSILAKQGFNILDMLNKSRGDVAYTLLDVDKPITPKTCQEIATIDGVLSVRNLTA